MDNANLIIDFEGPVSFKTMEELLNQLKADSHFTELRKPVRKRLYGTVVESIDNIYKYSAPVKGKVRAVQQPPSLVVRKEEGKFVVAAGNLVLNEQVDELRFKLNRVNQLDNEALKSLYEEVINKEAGEADRGAGLGLITLALRTDEDIRYTFDPVGPVHAFFTMQITIKE